MRVLPVPCLCLVLCGCATPTPPGVAPSGPVLAEEVQTPAAARSDVVCSNDRTTGSHIARRRCVTRAEQERISEDSQEWMRTGGAQGSPYFVPDSADPRGDVASPE
jgi:hypothetical protein